MEKIIKITALSNEGYLFHTDDGLFYQVFSECINKELVQTLAKQLNIPLIHQAKNKASII